MARGRGPFAAKAAATKAGRDGSGYPDGLSGSDIPLGAQLFRLLDTCDHLTRGRSSKPSEDTLVMTALDRQVSKGYDGRLLNALLQVVDGQQHAYDVARETKVALDDLEEGMVLSRDLRTETGVLLVAKDETLRKAYIDKIRNMKAIYPLDALAYVYRWPPWRTSIPPPAP